VYSIGKSHWAGNNTSLFVVLFKYTLALMHATRSSTYGFYAAAIAHQLGLGKAVSSMRLATIQNVADAVAHLQ